MERLQKYMASCGVASRRKSEEYILNNRVKVNDVVITELGYKIDEEKDIVKVDDKIIYPEEHKVYIALNKPISYISTVKDEKGRKKITDLVNVKERIYPIGRLDYDTSGLIILTNDGDVCNKLIHPRHMINKVYIAEIEGTPTNEDINKFCTGIDLDGYKTAPAKFKVIKKLEKSTMVKIVIHEGKNRQIRRMCDAINHKVKTLKRISMGDIELNDIKVGEWRFLSDSEIEYLKNI